jgi:predicted transcriptional regulator
MFEYFNGYWNWASINPNKINSTSTAIYFYILSIANELHWKESFGLSATQIMNGVNIATYKTYKKHFDELVENGLIKVVQPSINQYKCNVIALVKFTIAQPKQSIEQDQSTNQSTTHIHKTIKEVKENKEYKDKEPKSISDFVKLIESEKYLGTDELLNKTFINFIQMRISIKKTPTKNAVELLVKSLKQLSNSNKDLAIKIIENSILNNWQKFFELKNNNSNNFVKQPQPVFNRSSQGQHYVGDDVK